LDIDPSVAFNFFEDIETIPNSDGDLNSLKNNQSLEFNKNEYSVNKVNDSKAAFLEFEESYSISGFEPVLGGQLSEKAIWVDEAECIGCQYCVHVANNTFIVDERLGRSRVVRQNGDNLEIVQEAIDTCPVDCIHWVDFEDLEKLDKSLNRDMFQSLGKLPRVNRY